MFKSDPLAASADYRRWKAGELTDEQYYARLAMRSCPVDVPTPTNWRRAIWRAAAKRCLTVPDVVSLERNKGGTEE